MMFNLLILVTLLPLVTLPIAAEDCSLSFTMVSTNPIESGGSGTFYASSKYPITGVPGTLGGMLPGITLMASQDDESTNVYAHETGDYWDIFPGLSQNITDYYMFRSEWLVTYLLYIVARNGNYDDLWIAEQSGNATSWTNQRVLHSALFKMHWPRAVVYNDVAWVTVQNANIQSLYYYKSTDQCNTWTGNTPVQTDGELDLQVTSPYGLFVGTQDGSMNPVSWIYWVDEFQQSHIGVGEVDTEVVNWEPDNMLSFYSTTSSTAVAIGDNQQGLLVRAGYLQSNSTAPQVAYTIVKLSNNAPQMCDEVVMQWDNQPIYSAWVPALTPTATAGSPITALSWVNFQDGGIYSAEGNTESD